MASFLSKLFRKKKGPDETSTSASKASSKKSRKSATKKKSKGEKNGVIPTSVIPDVVKPPQTQELRRPSNGGTSNYSSASGSEPHVRVLSPRNQVPNLMEREFNDEGSRPFGNVSGGNNAGKQQGGGANNKNIDNNNAWGGPVDLDESDLGSDTDENQLQSRNSSKLNHSNHSAQQRLSVQQLHRFDMQQQKREASAQFYMRTDEPPRFSAGHVPVDDMNRSEASSSSFNLSTDAEDTEYEALKRRGVVPTPAVLDSSHLSGVSSPTNYNTDGDNSIFPALQTDDEGTATERDSQPGGILPAKVPTTDEDDDDNRKSGRNARLAAHSSNIKKNHHLQHIHHVSTSEDDEEERAWTISPRKDGSNPFPFHNPTSPNARRNFTSPKLPRSPNSFAASALSTSQVNTSNEFANFADFSNVTFPADTESWGAPKPKNKIVVDSPASPLSLSDRKTHRPSSSVADMTLSDILAQAKGKRASTGSHRSTGSGSHHNRRVSSSSVNSAPAITAKYLRQHHNLKPASRNSSEHHDGTTPVSDIIDSLEMANASRAAGGSSTKSLSKSGHSLDTSRAAKDRLRERRRRDREYSSSRRKSDPNQTTESSEGSDQEASESWLFDEVTGALGPRGIAADLESLSGRSKSSSGNKSHKSHRSHRSHRSHGRSRRRKSGSKHHHHPSSGESVDSRGSRHSRGSRYSHRSTRSYLSQMSEQSRSVANDLLRLEMQLAMVGSQDNNAAAVAAAAAGSSASVASRTSRKSRSSARRTVAIARRNKVTIQAPPGKLGIILANKADSKGTVVSGVRSSSVLSEKISPGDRIVAIDGEDVSLMTVSEITTIMARKSDFERTLTVLTTPKHSVPTSSSQPTGHDPSRTTRSSKEYDSFHNRYSGSTGAGR